MYKKISFCIVCLFFIIIMLLVYSTFIATRGLKVKEYSVYSNDIDDSFNYFKIVHISDILFNSNTDIRDLDKIVDEVNDINPNVIFFTGDVINDRYKINSDDKEYLVNLFSKLDSTYGKYAILGDNDYSDILSVKDIYLSSGFIILDNEFDIIYNSNMDKIFIGGVSSTNRNEGDIKSIMNYFNDNDDISYKIMLIHEPDYIDSFIHDYDIDLVLGGHSLNGQVNIPLIKRLYLKKGSTKYYNNYYNINNSNIYISSGIGTYKTNFRLFNKPSINYYILKKKLN